MHIAEIDPTRYEKFLTGIQEYLHQQTPSSAVANRANGRSVRLVALWDGPEVKAVAKLCNLQYKKIFRSVELYFGPIFDTSQPEVFGFFVQELLRYVKRDLLNIRLRIVPLVEAGRITNGGEKNPNKLAFEYFVILQNLGFSQLRLNYDEEAGIQAKFFYVKEFRGRTEDEIRASFTSSCRGHMRKAEHFGIRIRFLGSAESDLFNDILRATMLRTGMPAYTANTLTRADFEAYGENMLIPLAYIERSHSLAVLQRQMQELNDELIMLESGKPSRRTRIRVTQLQKAIADVERRMKEVNEFCDQYGETVNLATAQFFFTETDCSYYQCGALAEGFIFSPVYAIHDLMFRLAIKRKVKRYNMFAVSNPVDKEHTSDGGVMKFKENFNGEYIEFLGTFEKKLRFPFLQTE